MFLKKIYNIFLFLSSILLLPFILFVILFRPFLFIRFGILEYKRIGHLALDTAIFYEKKQINKYNKTFDILFYSNFNVSNKELIKIWKTKFLIFNLPIFSDIIISSFKLINKDSRHILKLYSLEKESHLLLNKNFIKFDTKSKFKLDFLLKKINFNYSNWICIHNRDSAFMKKNFKFASSKIINNNTQRNFTIDDFLPTIEYFKNKKINIIRVGSIQEFPIKKKFSYLFDYSFSKIKDDILDLYFLSNCKFYIGSDSGIGNVSVISNKLVGIINSTYYNNIMIQNFKRGVIFKKFFSKDKDRFLSLNEIFENKFHILTTFNEFYNLNIECINNTPEEIKNFANELLLRSNKNDFTYEYNQTDREYHREFWNIVKYYDKYSIVNYKNIFIGNNFLKNNLHLINA